MILRIGVGIGVVLFGYAALGSVVALLV